jgi:hypothetical protein
MADETRIDPDGAIRIFNVLTEIGEDIDVALSKVTDIRARVVEPWGNDDYGRPFAGLREQNAENALEGIGFVVEGLTGLGSEGRRAVNEFVKRDGENGAGLGPDS